MGTTPGAQHLGGLSTIFLKPILYGILASISFHLVTWEKSDRAQDQLTVSKHVPLQEHFDFVIVGAGTAGSILAAKLTENTRFSVLLLEAGGEPHPLQFIPGLSHYIVKHSTVDWKHTTVAQSDSHFASNFRRASWSQGKGLGGSGNIDYMIYERGTPQDYDSWANITGDTTWAYKNVVKEFQNFESFGPSGSQGPNKVKISLPDYVPLADQFIAAGKQWASKSGHIGNAMDYSYLSMDRGERQVPFKSFLKNARKNENLTVKKYSYVTKILIRHSDNRVYGVQYERHGVTYTALANMETVLSAGVIGSPKLLLQSGIGPKKYLREVGIPSKVDLPVGQNLQDHVATFLGPFILETPNSFNPDRDLSSKSFLQYNIHGTGVLTSSGFEAKGILTSSIAKKSSARDLWPDVQLVLSSTAIHQSFSANLAHEHGLNETLIKSYYDPYVGKDAFHILVSLGRPFSTGEMRLASSNPNDPLIINPKYLSDPLDMQIMIESVKSVMQMIESSAEKEKLGVQFSSKAFPGCEDKGFRSDEYWNCYIKHLTVSLNHQTGTCAMGPVKNRETVVDSRLRVKNMKNLRVVDASVIPSIPVGGTQASVILIAHKAASMIKSFWTLNTPTNEEKFNQSPEKFTTVLTTTPTLQLKNWTRQTDVITRLMKLQLPKLSQNSTSNSHSMYAWKPLPSKNPNNFHVGLNNQLPTNFGSPASGSKITNGENIGRIPVSNSVRISPILDNLLAESKAQGISINQLANSNNNHSNNENSVVTPKVPIFYLVRKPKEPGIGNVIMRPSPAVSMYPSAPFHDPYGPMGGRPPFRRRRPILASLFQKMFATRPF